MSMGAAARHAKMHFNTFKKYAIALGVYAPNQSGAGTAKSPSATAIPLEAILEGAHPAYGTTKLKRRLLNANLLRNECYICKMPPLWNGRALVLQLDHESGDAVDHRLANLRLLCPNCHSQTRTFCGKNRSVNTTAQVQDAELVNSLHANATLKAALEAVGLSVAKFGYQRCHRLIADSPELMEKFKLKPVPRTDTAAIAKTRATQLHGRRLGNKGRTSARLHTPGPGAMA
jgi:hypothetical protein